MAAKVAPRELLVSELWIHPRDSRVGLNGSGVAIVNPPYLLDERMRAWLPVLHTLGARTWHGSRLMVSRAHTLIGPDGMLEDAKTRAQLADFINRFAAFASAATPPN